MILRNPNFYEELTNHWSFEVNGEQIPIPRIDSHTVEWFLENSNFIGFQLTDRVSPEIEVRFGFAMLDYPLSVVSRAKMRLSGSMRKLTKLQVRCTTGFKTSNLALNTYFYIQKIVYVLI